MELKEEKQKNVFPSWAIGKALSLADNCITVKK